MTLRINEPVTSALVKFFLAALAFFFLLEGLRAQSSELHPIGVDDLLAVNMIGSPWGTSQVQISPDGKWVVYQMRKTLFDQNKYVFDLWLIDSEGKAEPKQLTHNDPTTRSMAFLTPRWSPNSKTIAYFATGEEGKEIALISMDDFSEHRLNLTEGLRAGFDVRIRGTVSDFKWSPDGRSIAFTAGSPSGVEKDSKPMAGIEVDVMWHPKRAGPVSPTLIYTVEINTEKVRSITDDLLNVHTFDWSPDGTKMVLSASGDTQWDNFMKTDLYVVDVESGKVSSLIKQPGSDSGPVWSPDGRWIAFNSQRGVLDWRYTTSLAVIPALGGEPVYPAEDFKREVGSSPRRVRFSPDCRTLYFEAPYHMTHQLFSVPLRGGKVVRITPEDTRYYTQFSFSEKNRKMAFTVQSVTEPAEIYVSRPSPFQPVRLTEANPQLRNVATSTVEILDWRSKDDKWDIHGILVKPPDYRADKKYPLLVFLAGGPSMLRQKFNFGDHYPLLVFAAREYLVLSPNTRGRYGYGYDFDHAMVVEKNYAPGPFEDMMAGVDLLIEKCLADPERLGVIGFSYGAYLTAFTVTQTDRFKAASMGDGISNVPYTIFPAGGDPSAAQLIHDLWGFDPPYDPEELKEMMRQSPIHHIQNVKTPMLLEYGSESYAPDHGRILFHGLQFFRVPSEFVVYPRTGHGITEPVLIKDSYDRNLEWFDYWVLDKATERMKKWRQK